MYSFTIECIGRSVHVKKEKKMSVLCDKITRVSRKQLCQESVQTGIKKKKDSSCSN